jgi:hypothetical protein
MKYIIPLAVMAAIGAGMALIENNTADVLLCLLFCLAGFFFGKNVAQYFSLKKKSR